MSDKERLKNIKIVVSDLDGTLLKNDGSVGEETKKLIRELHNYDVLFSFATGRLHSAVTDIAKDLEIKNPIISLDGSVIKDFPSGETIFESFLKIKYVEKAVKYADDYLLNVALCHADAIYFTEFNTVIPNLLNKFGAKYKEVSSYDNLLDKTLEIVLAGDNKESIEFVKDKFTFPYAFGCNASYYRSQSKRGLYYLDIRRAGSSKGKGLKRLLKYLHIKPHQSVVMGDWYNDISMFESDAIKVAVANSIPELIRNADHVTERSNNNEGPAEFLEMILRAKKD
ncbi:MAG: HAD family hydrolase [Bacteroidetes bacterium]|nr:HAD family hydrolase [Bacteroidota bacterium]